MPENSTTHEALACTSKPSLRAIKLVLAYDGSDFSGWQKQKNGRSVQEELEKALSIMHKHEVRVVGSARTDAGVHAMGQAASFYTDIASIPANRFVLALNKLLPRDVRVLSSEEEKPDFHARFDASLRRYRYFLSCGGTPDPFTLRYAHFIPYYPCLTILNAMASVVLGEHDFSTFASAQDKSESRFRFISESVFFLERDLLVYQIAGNAFLWRQVRSLVGTFLELEKKAKDPGEAEILMREVLESKDRSRAGPTAPACGLFLWNIEYGERVHGHTRKQHNKKESSKADPISPVWEGIANPSMPMRADRYLSEIIKLMTRSQLKARNAHLFCNGVEVKFSHKLKSKDRLRLEWTEAPSGQIEPEAIPLEILYQDADVYVIDKPQGMVTHPAAGNWHGTLANAVLWLDHEALQNIQVQDSFSISSPARAGIVHRLDKDTSGVIIVARTAAAQEFLSSQFREHQARKEYFAIVRGIPPEPKGRIDTWIARNQRDRKKFTVSEPGRGKHALTLYRVCRAWEANCYIDDRLVDVASKGAKPSIYSLLALYPRTGRTHQLRVHCANIGCPILGDPIYGKKDEIFPEATLMLHAHRLKIRLPSRSEPSVFSSPFPTRFRDIISYLDKHGHNIKVTD
mgnify:FL=1